MSEAKSDTAGRSVVLVVDDEYELLVTLRETLSQYFEVETASSAEEAELMLASREYDAILCDHMLPGEQGLDFLVRSSNHYPSTKRFLLTGYMNPDFISRSIHVGKLSACFLKPIKSEDLCRRLRETLYGV